MAPRQGNNFIRNGMKFCEKKIVARFAECMVNFMVYEIECVYRLNMLLFEHTLHSSGL